MEPVMTAQVAVDKAALPFDRGYSYAVPEELRATLRPGCRVLVPFGGGNAKRQGVVLSLEEGVRLGMSLWVFRRRRWMVQLSS